MSDSLPPGATRKKRFPATLNTAQKAVKPASSAKGGPAACSANHAVQGVVQKRGSAAALNLVNVSGNMDSLRLRMAQRLYQLGIRHEGVLKAMADVPRHIFLDTALGSQAYEDTSLPIGLGQTISKPSVVARMVELIMPADGSSLRRVLEIGTGGGYQAAVLAQLAHEVYSIERLKGLHERSRTNLRPLRLKNVHLIYGDGMQGFPSGAPYDAIIAAAGGDDIPLAWLEQLALGGALVAPVVTGSGSQTLVKVERTAQGWQKYVLEAVQFVPLKGGVS